MLTEESGLAEDVPMSGKAARQSAFRAVPWRWTDVVIGIAPLALARVAPAFVPPERFAGAPRWLFLPMALLAPAWMLGYSLWVGRRRDLRFFGVPGPRAILIEAGIALLSLPVLLLAMGVTVLGLAAVAGGSEPPPNPFEGIARAAAPRELLALMLVAVLVAPVAEETFFRGLLYNALRQRVNWILAALLQAAAFGLLHPFAWISATAIAVVGLVLSLLYEWRKTLLTPMFLHALQNVAAAAVLVTSTAAYFAGPVLGVSGSTHEKGLRLTVVAPGTAAAVAGLRVGDVITAVDGKPVSELEDLVRIVGKRRVGDRVTVKFMRNGDGHEVEAVLKKRRE